MPLALDLDTYAEQAEHFIGAMDREYYLHFAGTSPSSRSSRSTSGTPRCSSARVVDELRERLARPRPGTSPPRAVPARARGGRSARAARPRQEETALAEREAALEIEVDGRRLPYRQSAVAQANEPDPERRAAIEAARLDVLERELNPLHLQALERAHELARELGWHSYREMYEELKQIDLGALERQTSGLPGATPRAATGRPSSRSCARRSDSGFDELRRSDLPYFFRAPGLRRPVPGRAARRGPRADAGGTGDRPARAANVRLDTEQRPQKSPRAFCAPVQVPDEVYLVIPRTAAATTTRRCSTRRATPSTTRTSMHRCRSSSATSATTRSRRASRSCSST